ncbi:DUF4328 domain-containing protein [Tepidiforma bonchosmolovskayae]|uniref:DUF4328 domain-containing protein n=1 Tax=Tepidiforma bonchosmolovskayae TaxID=2601677 RepID=A0ABX6C2L0_9CHLR|nr:DUF4328 domain-containing protein [Tepidiforma bonchosmolovskayae]
MPTISDEAEPSPNVAVTSSDGTPERDVPPSEKRTERTRSWRPVASSPAEARARTSASKQHRRRDRPPRGRPAPAEDRPRTEEAPHTDANQGASPGPVNQGYAPHPAPGASATGTSPAPAWSPPAEDRPRTEEAPHTGANQSASPGPVNQGYAPHPAPGASATGTSMAPAWSPPARGAAPFGVPLLVSHDGWVYRSASGLATAITVLLVLRVILMGISAILGLAGAAAANGYAVVGSVLVYYLAILLGYPDYILLIVWTRRITGNLRPFQPALELGTGWAVGSWFVPIINLWFPLRIWNQAWRATTPTIAPPIGWQWKGLPVPPTHIIAWITPFIAAIVLALGLTLLESPEDEINVNVGNIFFISIMLDTVAKAVLILVVRNLTARQDAYARYWGAQVGPPAAS